MPSSTQLYDAKSEKELMVSLWDPRIKDDLLAFVLFSYPWGKVNTPLDGRTGPRKWQADTLDEISQYIKDATIYRQIHKELPPMFKKAIAAGRGIGKSAMLAWLAHWQVSTRLGSSVWVAANGEPQLRTRTFPEISKWVAMAINKHWFDIAATAVKPASWFSALVEKDLSTDPQYWYIQAQLWSEENPSAFSGQHNVRGEMFLFDEASGIPSSMWPVAQGVFTEEIVDRYWLAISNPRRNEGAFHECFFGESRDEWRGVQVDARTVENMPKDAFDSIIKVFGAESDEARMEVYGQFPNQADRQFIPNSLVADAQVREPIPDPGAPLLMGVDVARSLNRDKTVIAFRQGRDATVIPWISFRTDDLVVVANRVAEAATKYGVDAIFIDGNGVGGGPADILKHWKFRLIEVQSGSGANDEDRYKNKRAEMWGVMKEWLGTGTIPKDPTLRLDLVGPEYSYDPVSNRLVLESKEHMRDKRKVASPDTADALAMTFAQPVARNDRRISRTFRGNQARVAPGTDYAMFD